MTPKQQYAYDVGASWFQDPHGRSMEELGESAVQGKIIGRKLLPFFNRGFQDAIEGVIEEEPEAVEDEEIEEEVEVPEEALMYTYGLSSPVDSGDLPSGIIRVVEPKQAYRPFRDFGEVVYPFPIKDPAKYDLTLVLEEQHYPEYAQRFVSYLDQEKDYRYDSALEWVDTYTNEEFGNVTEAVDAMTEIMRDIFDTEVIDTEKFGEFVTEGVRSMSRAVPQEYIAAWLPGSSVDPKRAQVVYEIELWLLGEREMNKLDTLEEWIEEFSERYEDDPEFQIYPETTVFQIAFLLLSDPELTGRNARVEYVESVDDESGAPQGILIVQPPGSNALIFDLRSRQWNITDPENYMLQFPGRFRQLGLWEIDPEFLSPQEVPIFVDAPERPVQQIPFQEEVQTEYLDKFPSNTELAPMGDMFWSKWMGKLAMVTTDGGWRSPHIFADPSVYPAWFDPETLRQKYAVRYATKLGKDAGKFIKAQPEWINKEIIVQDPNVPYEDTTFKVSEYFGDEISTEGGFSEIFHYWIKIKLKDLSTGQLIAYQRWLNQTGFLDASDINGARKISKARWKKALDSTYTQLQDSDDWELASIIEDLIEDAAGYALPRPLSEDFKNDLWNNAKGIYLMKKTRDGIKLLIDRAAAKKRRRKKS